LKPAYVRACRWFRSGLIDRTNSLRIGLPYFSLDPIPRIREVGTFASIADVTGEQILRESLNTERQIQVLWSGGIDSTVAVISLSKAAFSSSLRSRIQIVCSAHSIQEYRDFFLEHVAGKFSSVVTTGPIGNMLDDAKLIVTGEHGDQLFGSVKLQSLVNDGSACRPYRTTLNELVAKDCGSPSIASEILGFLAPQIDRAPINIETVFDYFWWVNFSLKWQHVTLRLAVFRGTRFWSTYLALRHFFRGRAFQCWALTNPDERKLSHWSAYKLPAKKYILDFTGDHTYFQLKTKEPSLQNVLFDHELQGKRRIRVFWCLGDKPWLQYFSPKKT
jgi:hypothetical protein